MTTRALQTIQNGLETTHQNAVSATGNGTAATVNGFGSIAFQVTGTFTATVTFEASVDGSNYETIAVIDADGDRVTSATSTGLYRADIAGYKYVRTPVAWTSGTSVTVKSLALPGQRTFDVPVKQYGSNVEEITLVSAAAITDTASYRYEFVADGGLTKSKVRQAKDIYITVKDTHNETGLLEIVFYNDANGAYTGEGVVYNEGSILGSRLLVGTESLGTGANTQSKVVPALKQVKSDIQIRIKYDVAPTSGDITINALLRY